jgi:hemerythrin-like domain-containing protein
MGGGPVTGDPLVRFQAEHQEALMVLGRLEGAALALRRATDAAANLAPVLEAHAFLSTAVRAHNDNEERALFPLLGDDAPTAVFIEEHRELRVLEAELARVARAGDVRRTADVALEVVELLRAHIAREDDVLFPMARERLGPAGLAEVAARLGDA